MINHVNHRTFWKNRRKISIQTSFRRIGNRHVAAPALGALSADAGAGAAGGGARRGAQAVSRRGLKEEISVLNGNF
jgi:hypothetical protein